MRCDLSVRSNIVLQLSVDVSVVRAMRAELRLHYANLLGHAVAYQDPTRANALRDQSELTTLQKQLAQLDNTPAAHPYTSHGKMQASVRAHLTDKIAGIRRRYPELV